jgi:hypothetical protein
LPSELDRAKNVRCRTTCGKSDNNVPMREARSREITCATCRRVFGCFVCPAHRSCAAGNQRLNRLGARAERRRALGGIQSCQSAARPGPYIEKPAAIRKAMHNGVDRASDLRQLPPNSDCHAGVFAIDHAKDLKRRFFIEPSRARISLFGAG